MSTSQDSPQKFHEYNSDDRQLLVGLLHEYSEKLIEASRKVARSRTDREELNSVLLFSIALCTVFSYWLLQLFINHAKSSELQNSLYTSLYVTVRDNLFLTIVFTSISLFTILGVFILKNKSFSSSFEKDLMERDARMIASRLDSAMKLTVEIADRVETNLARKLELDLRIDDASSALEYYYSVVNLKSKSQSRSRNAVP